MMSEKKELEKGLHIFEEVRGWFCFYCGNCGELRERPDICIKAKTTILHPLNEDGKMSETTIESEYTKKAVCDWCGKPLNRIFAETEKGLKEKIVGELL